MFTKEPTEVRIFQIDWLDWLGSLTISTSVWSVPSGITNDSDTNTTTATQIQLSGGTWGATYELTNTITASNGEVETRTLIVTIQRSVSYCTPLEVRRRMFGGSGSGGSATTTALPQAELEALIEQASRMFDLVCGVSPGYFNAAPIPIATSRTIYGEGTSYLRLPPYVPGSLNTTLTVPTNYTAPSFIEKDGFLVLVDSNGIAPQGIWRYPPYITGWWEGVGITVSAIWGFLETPADIRMAIIELVINLKRETDPAELKLTDIEGQPLREKLPPRVAEVARRYRPQVGAAFA